MAVSMSIVEARRRLTQLPEALRDDRDGRLVEVTRRGKPVLAILPWDEYESIVETIEILSDPELMAAIRESAKDFEEGRWVRLEEIEAELGL